MNCSAVRVALWEYMAGTLPPDDTRNIALHLDACLACERHCGEVRSTRSGLKHLPQRRMPPELSTKLLVLASRERSRRIARHDLRSVGRELASRARLSFDHLLKPFAVPAAGGILASFLCFGFIVNTLHVVPDWDDDMPLGLFSEVTIDQSSPFCFGGRDVLVQLTVDSGGNVTDYELPKGKGSPEELQEVGNMVMYSTFTPATRFGQPVSSKRLLLISHINVKG